MIFSSVSLKHNNAIVWQEHQRAITVSENANVGNIAHHLEKLVEFIYSVCFPFDFMFSGGDQLSVLERKIAEMGEGLFQIKHVVELDWFGTAR